LGEALSAPVQALRLALMQERRTAHGSTPEPGASANSLQPQPDGRERDRGQVVDGPLLVVHNLSEYQRSHRLRTEIHRSILN
jgi:hypothetical protein